MEFWGVEVEPGESLKVHPEEGRVILISQASIGVVKKLNRTDLINLELKIGGSPFYVGLLSADKIPRLAFTKKLSFDKEFELSHDWKDGSVYFMGCSAKKSSKNGMVAVNFSYCASDMPDGPSEDDNTGTKVVNEKSDGSSSTGNLVPSAKPENAFADFVISMEQGYARFQTFLCEGSEILKRLDASFEELFTLISNSIREGSSMQTDNLFVLASTITEDWESVENRIEQLGVRPASEPVPSAWVLLSEWHELAYEELQSIRNKHSCLLDLAYRENECRLKSNTDSSLSLLMFKCLNFLASSRDDINHLSKDKCYKWVMRSKSLVKQRKYVGFRNHHEKLLELPASSSNNDQIPLNGKDKIYEKIITFRKSLSWELDEAYRDVHGLCTTGEIVHKSSIDLLKFLGKSLLFLAKSRADLVHLSEEMCLKELRELELFQNKSNDFEPVRLFWLLAYGKGYWAFQTPTDTTITTNWRDAAYEKLLIKMKKFKLRVYDVYLIGKGAWSREPAFADLLPELDGCIYRALDLYEMPRSTMSLFLSKDDYFKFVDRRLDALRRIKDIFTELQLGDKPDWNPLEFIPKRSKLAHL